MGITQVQKSIGCVYPVLRYDYSSFLHCPIIICNFAVLRVFLHGRYDEAHIDVINNQIKMGSITTTACIIYTSFNSI